MARTVGLRFRQAGKIFYYDARDFELEVGTYVVVDSAYGLAAGRVVIAPDQVIANEASSTGDMKPVLRIATDDDIERMEEMKEAASNALGKAKLKASELELDMALANGEFDLEGTQFTAYFSSAERVDFRNLVRDLSRDLGVRVQLLQVGDRDRAKLVDGFDICGERLCCSSWMTNFPSVSIRMAKEQDLPLNQSKLTGVCGRLKCCLIYELETYQEVKGKLPKLGETFHIPACVSGSCGTSGCATTQGVNVVKESIVVGLMDGGRAVYTAEELGVTFDAVPAHTRGVGSYGGDEVPRQERPTPVQDAGAKRKRRRRGRRGGRDRGALPPQP